MKKNIITILSIAALVFTTASCKEQAKEAETTDAKEVVKEETPKAIIDKYAVDATNSTIEWIGSKPTESHNGTINLKNGNIDVTDGKISGGSFTVDMNSIIVLDIPADKKGNAKLVGHLKNTDFFNTEVHPTATFEVTGLSETDGKTMLSGNFTLKAIEHNITFPVTVTNDGNNMTLTSETFSIDRTKWDIKFKSKTFGELGDKFIKDNIELKVTVKATKS